MKNFAGVDENGDVVVQLAYDGAMALDGMGPPNPFPNGPYEYFEIPEMEFNEPRPTKTCRLKWVNGARAWVETSTLAEFKSQREAEITKAKIEANDDYFTFQGKKVAVTEPDFKEMQSICAWVGMTGTMPPNWPGGWKVMGGGFVQFSTVPEWINFYGAMVQAGLSNFMKSEQLKAQIENATTHDQVAAINW
jgi:hypothetical protein